MQNRKIIVSAFSNLSNDQRIEKVCHTLYQNGYQIELIGNNWGGEGPLARPYPCSRIKLASSSLKTAYFEFNWKLYRLLKKKADRNTLLYANDLDALLPNYRLSEKLNIPLVFDSHEIFSEMPAIQGKMSQKLWKCLEKSVIPDIKFMITASRSYSRWFKNSYGIDSVVVQNSPKKMDSVPDIPDNRPYVVLYQGALNPFRGIDKAILAMHHLDRVIFKIAGDGPMRKEYELLVTRENLHDKVEFLGKLLPEELRKVTLTADCGMSIEENGGASYYYSLPNKVLDGIQARVPLVLSGLPEMQQIISRFEIGEIIKDHQPEHIAEAIRKVLEKGRKSYIPELEKAAAVFCWEREEPKLLEIVDRALQPA